MKNKVSLIEWIKQARSDHYWFDWSKNKLFSTYLPNQLTSWDVGYLFSLRNHNQQTARSYRDGKPS